MRTLYELLSFSCNPFDFTSDCGRIEACDACSLFGTHGKRGQGYAGRVTFSDATPSGAAVRSEVRWLPVGHDPDREKTNGEFRIYDLRSGEPPSAGASAPVKAAREIYMGLFRTRLSFANTTGEEIGRLLLCCGLREKSETGFPLRLGGVKYEGEGAMLAEVDSLTLRFPSRLTLAGDAARTHAASWIAAALGSPWGTAFRPTYDELVTVLNHQGGRP